MAGFGTRVAVGLALGWTLISCGSAELTTETADVVPAYEEPDAEGTGEQAEQVEEVELPLGEDGEIQPGFTVDFQSGMRDSLGFPAEDTEALMSNPEALRNFTARGYLLTDAEYAQFSGRNALADTLAQFLPQLSGLDGFAGAELVHEGDGVFRLYFADGRSIDEANEILSGVEPAQGTFEIVVAEFTEAELVGDMEAAWGFLETAGLARHVNSVSVLTGVGIEVGVDRTQPPEIFDEIQQVLDDAIDSSVELVAEDPGVEE